MSTKKRVATSRSAKKTRTRRAFATARSANEKPGTKKAPAPASATPDFASRALMDQIQMMYKCVIGPPAAFVQYAGQPLPYQTLGFFAKTQAEAWHLLMDNLFRLYRTVEGWEKPLLIWRRPPTWEQRAGRGALSCRLAVPRADFSVVSGIKEEGEPVPGDNQPDQKTRVMSHLHKILEEIADELVEEMPWLK